MTVADGRLGDSGLGWRNGALAQPDRFAIVEEGRGRDREPMSAELGDTPLGEPRIHVSASPPRRFALAVGQTGRSPAP